MQRVAEEMGRAPNRIFIGDLNQDQFKPKPEKHALYPKQRVWFPKAAEEEGACDIKLSMRLSEIVGVQSVIASFPNVQQILDPVYLQTMQKNNKLSQDDMAMINNLIEKVKNKNS